MPEGPEVRTVVDQLQKGGAIGRRLVDIQFLSGRYVRHGRPVGFEAFARTMTPWFQPHNAPELSAISVDIIQDWNATGKFIYICLDDGSNPPSENRDDFQRSIWITLGMSGQFVNENIHQQDPRFARWFLELLDPQTGQIRKVYYHDQRNFGTLRFSLSRQELQDKLASLGPDILDPTNTTEGDFLAIVDKQRPGMNVCKFLMDQSKRSGIGNYILSECLYRAKIDPFASLQELTTEQRRHLFREAQAVALESYGSKGLTREGGTFRNVEGDAGNFQFKLQCYGRETCAEGNPVLKETEGPHKRAIWYTKSQLFMPLEERMNAVGENDKSAAQDPKTNGASEDAGNTGSNKLVSYGEKDLIFGIKDEGWQRVLADAIHSACFQNLQSFLTKEIASGATIYPPAEDVFAAFELCPFDSVKVVIVGQDPYHGPGQGHGLAFSVRKGVNPPPSLQNIFREARNDVSIPKPAHGNLEHWAQQGVLLLNTVLTVRQGEANSHKGQGWEEFTDQVIQALNDDKDKGLVFLLWGNPAAKKAETVDATKHTIIRTSHPSPLGATKTSSPFLGSHCFSQANEALVKMGHAPIDWTVV